MIDIDELRRKANSTDIVDHIDLHANIKPIVRELLDRLEAAEKEVERLRRGIAFRDDVVADLAVECDAMRAKIEQMEKQEPVAIQHRVPSVDFRGECVGYSEWKDGKGLEHWPRRTLYSLPGAQTQGEEK